MLEDAKTKLEALKSLLRNMFIRKRVKNDLNFQNKMKSSIYLFFQKTRDIKKHDKGTKK
jgi:3-methyladenine DNA glycosylase AlkC